MQKVTLNRDALKNIFKKKIIEAIRNFLNSNKWKGETYPFWAHNETKHPSRYLVDLYSGNPYAGNDPDIYTIHTYWKDVTGYIDENGKIKINLTFRIEETKGTYKEVTDKLGGHEWYG